MKCSRNIVGMCTTVGVLFAITVGLSGCGSTAYLIPLDDAYYYPEKKVAADASASSAPEETPVQPVVEFINVQDTIVTARIKR